MRSRSMLVIKLKYTLIIKQSTISVCLVKIIYHPLIMNLDNQWWFGRNLTNGNGQMGLFPSNFIFIPRDIRQKFNITVKTAD